MSGTLLGNQARSGYGGDNERLRFAVSLSSSRLSLQNAAQLPRGEVLTKDSSPELGSEFGQNSDPCLGSAGGSELFGHSDSKFRQKRPHNKGFSEFFVGTSPNQSPDNEVLTP